jgi:hypothetical protein
MNRTQLFFFAALSLMIDHSYAYSSFAFSNSAIRETASVFFDLPSQKEADERALSQCRSSAMKLGSEKIANQCKVVDRAKKSGYGAVFCGDKGCSAVFGISSRQDAINTAYKVCVQKYKNCPNDAAMVWNDASGFPSTRRAQQIPPSQTNQSYDRPIPPNAYTEDYRR